MSRIYAMLLLIVCCSMALAAPKKAPAPKAEKVALSGRETVKQLRKSFIGKDTATTESLTSYVAAMEDWRGDLEPRLEAIRREQMEYERARGDLQIMLESSGYSLPANGR